MSELPPPCDPEILQHGRGVFITHTISSEAMEEWVKQVCKVSGQRVDWHFIGGRAVVRCLGDAEAREAVRRAIYALLPAHDRAFYQECRDSHYDWIDPNVDKPSGMFVDDECVFQSRDWASRRYT